jgi:hypothetical protein
MTAELRPVGWTGPTGAKVIRHWRAYAALDNHTPSRREASVILEEIEWPPSDDGFTGVEFRIVKGLDHFRHGAHAVWLLDDGGTLRVMYTATYHPTERTIGVKTFTPDSHNHGPATVYHLRITEV